MFDAVVRERLDQHHRAARRQCRGGGTRAPARLDIVGETAGALTLASGVAVEVGHAIDSVDTCDIVIIPSLVLEPRGWVKGRYPRLTAWLAGMHAHGAVLCSACSGIFLLAEMGLFDGRDATVHFGHARPFAAAYPVVTIHPERPLVTVDGDNVTLPRGSIL